MVVKLKAWGRNALQGKIFSILGLLSAISISRWTIGARTEGTSKQLWSGRICGPRVFSRVAKTTLLQASLESPNH